MQSVTLSIEFNGYSSGEISPALLGTNLLFHSDRTNETSDFNSVIEAIGISFIRYPGGTISEQFFDISNPNSNRQSNILDVIADNATVENRDVLPLIDFLLYMQEISGTPVIVLPTFRFFDSTTGQVSLDAEEVIRGFVRNLFNNTFGQIDDIVIEIGNEWYQEQFSWTTEQFGQLQATISSWIDDEVRNMGERDRLTLLAQTGRNEEDNGIFASYFEGGIEPTIDGVLTHFYGTNSSGNPLGAGGGIGKRLEEINLIWGRVLGNDFDLSVTEWNVGENGEDSTLINGIMRFAPLMRIYGEMLENGTDLAMIWSTQTRGPAGLSAREGQGDDLSPTGYFYSLLSSSLEGMRLVDTGTGPFFTNSASQKLGYNYTFEDDGNIVSYFVSGVAEEIDLSVDLSAYFTEGAYVYATILGAVPGESGTEYWSDASIQYATDIDLSDGLGNWLFEFQISSYELVELHIVVGEGITIIGDRQNAIDDRLVGSNFSDLLVGNLGADTILGGFGDDSLNGGAGEDHLSGGNDHDTLWGGAGDDTLLGEHGRDYLEGGLGNDYLDGGYWHDTLVGGDGEDVLLGGFGDDLLRMGNGGGIASGGAGDDTLSFADATENVTIWTAEGAVEVGLDIVYFNSVEVIRGSNYDDRFIIAYDHGQLFGGNGDDTFEFRWGRNNVVHMEEGDDLVIVYESSQNQIFGDSGNDEFLVLFGGNRLIGGAGDDRINLYSDEIDTLIFRAGDGNDVIRGFQLNVDEIELYGLLNDNVQISQNAAGTLLDFGLDGSIYLEGNSNFDIENAHFFV